MKDIKKKLLLPFLVLAYLLLALDTVKYPGFVGKHFLIDAKVFATAAIIALFFSKYKFSKWTKNIALTLLIVSSFGYIFFSWLEGANYVNYVLTKYHISLEALVFLPVFGGSILLASSDKIKKLIKAKQDLWTVVLGFFVIYALFVNFGKALNQALYSNFYVLTHLRDSYDQKMTYQWGDFYDYMVFVRQNTPEDASIIIPPHVAPWWNRSGDLNLVKSFLYPRNLIQYSTKEIPDLNSLPKDTYIMIAWGEWNCDSGECYGWPVQEIPASEIIFKGENSEEENEILTDVKFDPEDAQYPYGLIKL